MNAICTMSPTAARKFAEAKHCINSWKPVALTVSKLALIVLVPLWTMLATCVVMPLVTLHVAVPIASIASVAASIFFYDALLTEAILAPGAPRGIANIGANCWVNSLFQMIHSSRLVQEWLLSGECHNELLPFQDFARSYRQALTSGQSVISVDSQTLRICIASLMKPGVDYAHTRHEDPTEGWTVIHDRLPERFKSPMIQTRHYEGAPEKEAHRSTLIAPTAHLSLAITGKAPSLGSLMEAHCNVGSDGSHLNIQGINYPKTAETLRFQTAPPSLWIDFKRFEAQFPEPGRPPVIVKKKEGIVLPNVYYLKLENESEVLYRLVSFAEHIGESGLGGHYVSYRKGPGDGLWYRISDRQVTQISEKEMRRASRQAYFVNYERV